MLLLLVSSDYFSELIEQRNELEQRRKMIADLDSRLMCYLPANQVQVTGEGKSVATVGKETSFELSLSSPSATSSTPFPIEQLWCQLTDPHYQRILCSITSTPTQSGVCTVKYFPTLPGPHKLRITIRDTDVPGSPFTVNVLPSPDRRGVVKYTISGLKKPLGVAVSNSGEVMVSENYGHHISVYREGKYIRSFRLLFLPHIKEEFKYPCGIAITCDNHILIVRENSHRIQKYTIEGRFVESVGKHGQKPREFNYPSGIAVHPSGRVFVADTYNHRIQVLNPDLSYSHMFGNGFGKAPKQFRNPCDVAINSSGVVYVTDYDNHRVQSFSGDGQLISSFGSKGSQHGQLCHPHGICIDSTNTVYVTDENNRVSMYTSSGQFINDFGTKGSGKGELHGPRGIAVDNTTGALYVCDHNNHRVVVY